MCKVNNSVNSEKEKAIGGMVQLATGGLGNELAWHYSTLVSKYSTDEQKKFARHLIKSKLQNFVKLHVALSYPKAAIKINVRQSVDLALIKVRI